MHFRWWGKHESREGRNMRKSVRPGVGSNDLERGFSTFATLTVGPNYSLHLHGADLCIVGCSAACLASAQ